jgi:hypothetical protein
MITADPHLPYLAQPSGLLAGARCAAPGGPFFDPGRDRDDLSA